MDIYDIKISKSEWQSIYISIGLSIAGYLLAITLCDPDMFARFGSLVVCIGVIFGIKGFPQILDAVEPIYQEQVDKLRATIEKACAGHQFEEQIRAEMDSKVEPKIKEHEQKTSRTVFAVKKRVLQIEGGHCRSGYINLGVR